MTQPNMKPSLNVLGEPLELCSNDPLTGWFRDGCCNTDERDRGLHTVCAQVTQPFLEYLKSKGNDLITPHPEYGFVGLKEGDQWCVCAASWYDAFQMGVACPIKLESTHIQTLELMPLEALLAHAIKN